MCLPRASPRILGPGMRGKRQGGLRARAEECSRSGRNGWCQSSLRPQGDKASADSPEGHWIAPKARESHGAGGAGRGRGVVWIAFAEWLKRSLWVQAISCGQGRVGATHSGGPGARLTPPGRGLRSDPRQLAAHVGAQRQQKGSSQLQERLSSQLGVPGGQRPGCCLDRALAPEARVPPAPRPQDPSQHPPSCIPAMFQAERTTDITPLARQLP